MNKIRRELTRAGMKFALNYPRVVPDKIAKAIFRSWNSCQRDFAAAAFATNDARPAPLPPLKLLDLSCTSGFGENVHPDVLYVPEGFGPGKWTYLMTCTPLPQGVEYFENPEFLVSMDGIDWKVPEGGLSPLISPPDDWIGYNSDPILLLENGELNLFYRECRLDSQGAVISLNRLKTHNGLIWSKKQTVLSFRRNVKDVSILMSPSIVNINSEYYLWYVWADSGKPLNIYRYRSKDLNSWSCYECVELSGLPKNEAPWHLDISCLRDNALLMALCSIPDGQILNKRIVFLSSVDNGLKWTYHPEVLNNGAYNFGANSLYRAALVLNSPDMLLYYSGQDMENHWSMSVIPLNNILPSIK
ncbi:MAG: hypothetical protein RR501_05555 [Cloacibacillus sp.]